MVSRIRVRDAVTAVPAVATVLVAWSMLEEPVAWRTFAVAGALAVLPTLFGGAWRIGVAVLAAGTMLAVAFSTWPHAAVGDAWTALHDAPAVRAPFDPTAYPSLDGLVVVAAFGLALGCVARRCDTPDRDRRGRRGGRNRLPGTPARRR